MVKPVACLRHTDVCRLFVTFDKPLPGGWPGWPWRHIRLDHPGQARFLGTHRLVIHLLCLVAVWMSGCVDERAADPVMGLAAVQAVAVTQDRLPAAPATRATATSPDIGNETGHEADAGASDESRWECEGKRQMICHQQWVGAQEKCQRMRCERIAGFWLLRDPEQQALNSGDFRSAIQERSR